MHKAAATTDEIIWPVSGSWTGSETSTSGCGSSGGTFSGSRQTFSRRSRLERLPLGLPEHTNHSDLGSRPRSSDALATKILRSRRCSPPKHRRPNDALDHDRAVPRGMPPAPIINAHNPNSVFLYGRRITALHLPQDRVVADRHAEPMHQVFSRTTAHPVANQAHNLSHPFRSSHVG